MMPAFLCAAIYLNPEALRVGTPSRRVGFQPKFVTEGFTSEALVNEAVVMPVMRTALEIRFVDAGSGGRQTGGGVQGD